MQVTIRRTREDEFFETEGLTREAFWDQFRAGCDEHLCLFQLRAAKEYVPELDLVAEVDGKAVAHIIYTTSYVQDGGKRHELLTFGPISVLPDYQKQGYGGALLRESIRRARALGYKAIMIYGHPTYYPRFGFENAEKYGITTPEGKNFDAFMILPLDAEAVAGIHGAFHLSKGYETTPEAVAAFEKKFPPKESHFVAKSGEEPH